MIKNYIFDFGNVLAEFDPIKLTQPYVPDGELCRTVSEVAFDRLYWDKLDSGDITDSQVREGILARLGDELGVVGCRVYDNWVNTMTPVPGMHRLIADIRKTGKRLYLLSNISTGFADTYKNVPWIKELLDTFDGVVLSGHIGKVKPDRDIFEYLLTTFDLKADECLFVDDSSKNIEGAKAVGIEGYLFDGDAEKLRAYLGIEIM